MKIQNPNDCIGKIVVKKSGKPFKNGLQKETVIGVTINPNKNKVAFTVSNSIVDVYQCNLQESN